MTAQPTPEQRAEPTFEVMQPLMLALADALETSDPVAFTDRAEDVVRRAFAAGRASVLDGGETEWGIRRPRADEPYWRDTNETMARRFCKPPDVLVQRVRTSWIEAQQ